jgi:Phosphotransferase enzyme family
MGAVPHEVLARLGPAPRDLSRLGSARVLEGKGLVLKAGPADRTAREALVLGELSGTPRLAAPFLVEAGAGWLLLRLVDIREPRDPAAWRCAALADLARLHDAFADASILADARLRDLTGREFPELIERSTELAESLQLPDPLRNLALNSAPLRAELNGGCTLIHGDAWPGNVLPTPDEARCWIDWEEAGVGHPALDLANWLHGSPWVPPAGDPEADLALYLEARAAPVDAVGFRRAVDAAVLLLFLLLDLPGIARWEESKRWDIVHRRAALADRFSD